MKKIILVSFLFLAFLSCEERQTTSLLQINTDNDSIKVVEIIRPIDGITCWFNKRDSLKETQKRNFKYDFNIDKAEVVMIIFNDERFQMIIQPDQKYEINLSDSLKQFKFDNAKGNEQFSKLKRPHNGYFDISYLFEKDSSAHLFSMKIDSLKHDEMKPVNLLLESKSIDKTFYDIYKNEVDYYYAGVTASYIIHEMYDLDPFRKDFDDLLKITLTNYPLNTTQFNSYWSDYAHTAVVDNEIYNKEREGRKTKSEIREILLSDSVNSFNENIIRKNLKGGFQEKLLARYIYYNTKQKTYDLSLKLIFDRFEESFPNSSFSEYLKPEIEEIILYHQKIKENLPESVHFITDIELNSFPELLKQFKGQKLYVDVWATWCGPCQVEFKYNEGLTKILEKHNYKKLFISVDDQDKKGKWIERIKFFNLNGYHILPNENFKNDFADRFSKQEGYFIIPQYLVIDENGKIITKDAPRPSEPEKLEKFLLSLGENEHS